LENHQIVELQRVNFLDVAQSRKIAVRKFVLLHSKKNKIMIEDISSSASIREIMQIKKLAKNGRNHDIDPYSWFSKQVSPALMYSIEPVPGSEC